MSRHSITVKNETQSDVDAVIGYGPPLRSFFLQAFPDPETKVYGLWLGGFLQEYPSLESVIEAARAQGFEVQELSRDVIVALTNEASTRTPPSVAERLGLLH